MEGLKGKKPTWRHLLSQIHSFLLSNVVDDSKTESQSWTFFFRPRDLTLQTLDAKFLIHVTVNLAQHHDVYA